MPNVLVTKTALLAYFEQNKHAIRFSHLIEACGINDNDRAKKFRLIRVLGSLVMKELLCAGECSSSGAETFGVTLSALFGIPLTERMYWHPSVQVEVKA